MSSFDATTSFARTLVDEWVRNGITAAVVSPGSRNTPLALALARDGRMNVDVVLDERSAGFRALGIGLATGRPAIVCCTSGTAAVNLHPAVVEAHYARVPLLACTADRPAELRGWGAGQTIDQAGLYGGAVRWFHDPGPPDETGAGSETNARWRAERLLTRRGRRRGRCTSISRSGNPSYPPARRYSTRRVAPTARPGCARRGRAASRRSTMWRASARSCALIRVAFWSRDGAPGSIPSLPSDSRAPPAGRSSPIRSPNCGPVRTRSRRTTRFCASTGSRAH